MRLVTLFGSAASKDGHHARAPRDLDVAVGFRHGAVGDLFGFVTKLAELAGPVEVDPLDLDAAEPVVRAEALSGVPLYEDEPGAFVAINSHICAAMGAELPTDYRSSFAAAAEAGALPAELVEALALSAGLRNAIVHAYLDVNLERVAAAVPAAQRDYRVRPSCRRLAACPHRR